MARRIDYDDDDGFEILNEQSSINTAQQSKYDDIGLLNKLNIGSFL